MYVGLWIIAFAPLQFVGPGWTDCLLTLACLNYLGVHRFSLIEIALRPLISRVSGTFVTINPKSVLTHKETPSWVEVLTSASLYFTINVKKEKCLASVALLIRKSMQGNEGVNIFCFKSMLANIPWSIFLHLHNLLIFKKSAPSQYGRKQTVLLPTAGKEN